MTRLQIYPIVRLLLVIVFALTTQCSLSAQRLIKAGEGYSSTSVNTTIFRNSSLVTHKGNQYIAYYDGEGYLTLGKRKIGKSDWETLRSSYKGNVRDAHNDISIMIDGDGWLHVAFDHHGNALRYCRSVAPETLTLGPLEAMTGEDEKDVTYPEFYRLSGGDLLFAYRSGASGRGNLVLNRYETTAKRWSRVQSILIDGENKRNAYWQMTVDRQGTLHLSWVWRETWLVETNHDLCYARSTDGGKSWTHADGTPYTLPIKKDNAEYAWRINQKSELINQTSMATDAKGNPYIATYWRDPDTQVPQYRVVWHDGKQWHCSQVSDRKTPFSLSGGGTKMIPIARPRMVVDGHKAYFLFRDQERGSKVSMYYTRDIRKGKWKVKDLTDFSVDAWEPSIDTELWNRDRKLHIFVQETHQGDGEKSVRSTPTPVYVLEVR